MVIEVKAEAPPIPKPRLCLGVTGHRAAHPGFAEGAAGIDRAFAQILDLVAAAVTAELGAREAGRTRVHSLLADGADQLVAREALRRGWELAAPLPVGADLNCAINAHPATEADARAVLQGAAPADPEVAQRAARIREFYAQAHLLELAESDAEIEALFLASFSRPAARASFEAAISARAALAARVALDQCDLVLALWDGAHTTFIGGTGHTIEAALAMGAPVALVDPAAPEAWRILEAPEALRRPPARASEDDRRRQIAEIVAATLKPRSAKPASHGKPAAKTGLAALDAAQWRPRSNPLWHAYRRIETLFGDAGPERTRNLRRAYETPQAFGRGSGAPILRALRDMPGGDQAFAERVGSLVLPRFAWADGISAYLSDAYRGGMMVNFILSAMAIIGGVAYLPFASSETKWAFALFELALLCAIVFVTQLGRRNRWHGRWFETRRAAEYLRHAPVLLALGAARAPGRWPRGADTSWPEWYARHALREVGWPRRALGGEDLRWCLAELLDPHVVQQRNYHHAKAARLTRVHHRLDHLSERLFQIAVASVAVFLAMQAAAWLHVLDKATLKEASKLFTFLGVALPTLGGAIAGIRYFGDFERFAAISEVTAQKLDSVHGRIALLLEAPVAQLDYASVANLAHAADEIVVGEIENWQAVFGGKQITIPV